MVEAVNVVFEGHSGLRPGFHRLFHLYVSRARGRRIRFNLVAGGSQIETVKDFLRYCRSSPDQLNVLLIDSEKPVVNTTQTIRDLRSHNSWDAGVACADEQINFMVQAMEAWFIADPQALTERFGQNFRINALPNSQNAESTTPGELVAAIRRELRRISARRRDYDKVADGAKLLQLIDPARVSQRCPHFKRLMDFLAQNI